MSDVTSPIQLQRALAADDDATGGMLHLAFLGHCQWPGQTYSLHLVLPFANLFLHVSAGGISRGSSQDASNPAYDVYRPLWKQADACGEFSLLSGFFPANDVLLTWVLQSEARVCCTHDRYRIGHSFHRQNSFC